MTLKSAKVKHATFILNKLMAWYGAIYIYIYMIFIFALKFAPFVTQFVAVNEKHLWTHKIIFSFIQNKFDIIMELLCKPINIKFWSVNVYHKIDVLPVIYLILWSTLHPSRWSRDKFSQLSAHILSLGTYAYYEPMPASCCNP